MTARYQLQKVACLCDKFGWERKLQLQLTYAAIISVQPQYSLLCRFMEWDIQKVCEEEGIGIIPWGPLAGGTT